MTPVDKLTIELIEEVIESTNYIVLPDTTTTICWLTLENGYIVTGESACVRPDMFDKKMGQSLAYEKALDKVWMLEGYVLKEALSNRSDENDTFKSLRYNEQMAKYYDSEPVKKLIKLGEELGFDMALMKRKQTGEQRDL